MKIIRLPDGNSRRVVTLEELIIASKGAFTSFPGYGTHEGDASFWFLFPDEVSRARFWANYKNAWVITPTMGSKLDYSADWKDIDGTHGLHLAQSAGNGTQLDRVRRFREKAWGYSDAG